MRMLMVIFMIFMARPVMGQIKLRNAHCNNPECKLLFRGIENRIIADGINPDYTISLNASSGSKISQYRKNEFTLFGPYSSFDTLKLLLNGKIVHTEIFTVDNMPDPVAIIGNFTDTALSTSQILLNPYLSVFACKSGSKSNYLITSFKLVVTNNSGDVFDFVNPGREFSQHLKNTIKTLGKGSSLNFHYIKATGPDNISRQLPHFTISIR